MSGYEVDSVTEFVDGGRLALKVSPRQNPVVVYGGTWRLLLDTGAAELTGHLVNGRLSGKEAGIYLLLVGNAGPGNTFVLSQKDLAKDLGVSVAYVSRVLIKLRALDLVRANMVSPFVITKGRTEDFPAVVQMWEKLKPGAVAGETLAFGITE